VPDSFSWRKSNTSPGEQAVAASLLTILELTGKDKEKDAQVEVAALSPHTLGDLVASDRAGPPNGLKRASKALTDH
jgi:hypothetical protein